MRRNDASEMSSSSSFAIFTYYLSSNGGAFDQCVQVGNTRREIDKFVEVYDGDEPP